MANAYGFSDHVRDALTSAREEAARLHHEYVGTEHILLGLLRMSESTALKCLRTLHVDPLDLKAGIEDVVKPGRARQALGADVPYTAGAKRVLELTMMAARNLGDSRVGSAHLLLGLVQQEKGIAALVLVRAGVVPAAIRSALGPSH